MTGQAQQIRIEWRQIFLASLLMVATLPGRTQGLGLITEPMLRDLQLDRLIYADINLWATLLGSAACLPAGWFVDRFGLRPTAAALLGMLGIVVWCMTLQHGSIAQLFLLILLTRTVGQSALSVVSISAVGKTSTGRVGLAMGVYAVLLSAGFAAAFAVVGGVVRSDGWRTAWKGIAAALVLGIAPLIMAFLRESPAASNQEPEAEPAKAPMDFPLLSALRTPAFWTFAGATALFGLVSSGLGLFNEAVLAERGFSQKIYHEFLAVTTLIALGGQFLCGWLSVRWSMQRLLGIALFVYAAGLAALPFLRSLTELWIFAFAIGLAAGMITVIFFAVWSHAFGTTQIGRIQGAAQMLTVFASAVGPLLFAKSYATAGSYGPLLFALAAVVLLFGVGAWLVSLPKPPAPTTSRAAPST